ncbi:hypothetical protein BpHYR1_003536 [Brachionus plicatilis]|uniref:Uncharacterized protein n=1 Tax=Brachionus plicatilis TaxID=10195 RepID=A0A3M7PHV2_BRAPC|nr:hypothetical protein BpHYR1_003536 [Brachionus plicatilis]
MHSYVQQTIYLTNFLLTNKNIISTYQNNICIIDRKPLVSSVFQKLVKNHFEIMLLFKSIVNFGTNNRYISINQNSAVQSILKKPVSTGSQGSINLIVLKRFVNGLTSTVQVKVIKYKNK